MIKKLPPEVFFKKDVKISQNSQKNACAINFTTIL